KPGKFDSGLIDAAVTPTGPIIVPQDEPTTDDSCVDAGGCETEEYEWIDAGPACGDGGVDDGEGCDDGNSLHGDGCDGVCLIEPNSVCLVPGQPCHSTIECGDGVVGPGEFGDDGNTENDDGCSSDCISQNASYYCPEPGQPGKRLLECGDGWVKGADECDDGHRSDADGSSSVRQAVTV